MKQIPEQEVQRWGTDKTWRWPLSIDTACPKCGRLVSLVVNANSDHVGHGKPASARCVRCDAPCRIYLVRPEEGKTPAIYMYPHPGAVLPPELADLSAEDFPDALRAAYVSTKRVLAMGEPVAAQVAARRVLEGLCHAILPEEKQTGPLYQQLKALVEHERLGADLEDLLDALRTGGNLGAHYDTERIPTQDSAEDMVSLLDYLIEALYVLPARIRSLKESFTVARMAQFSSHALLVGELTTEVMRADDQIAEQSDEDPGSG